MPAVGKYNDTFFRNYPEVANSSGVLYCVVLINKKTSERECLKIGITQGKSYKDVLKRASGFKGYDIAIQKIVKGTLKQVFDLEQTLHKQWEHKKFTAPAEKFGGWTELFSLDDDIVRSISL